MLDDRRSRPTRRSCSSTPTTPAIDAYVTLAGTLRDAQGTALGDLKPESLWIPAGEQRTFALVDAERSQRPGAAGAQIACAARVADTAARDACRRAVKTFDDYGKAVVQATLVNDADRPGRRIVIASFRDADRRRR